MAVQHHTLESMTHLHIPLSLTRLGKGRNIFTGSAVLEAQNVALFVFCRKTFLLGDARKMCEDVLCLLL